MLSLIFSLMYCNVEQIRMTVCRTASEIRHYKGNFWKQAFTAIYFGHFGTNWRTLLNQNMISTSLWKNCHAALFAMLNCSVHQLAPVASTMSAICEILKWSIWRSNSWRQLVVFVCKYRSFVVSFASKVDCSFVVRRLRIRIWFFLDLYSQSVIEPSFWLIMSF